MAVRRLFSASLWLKFFWDAVSLGLVAFDFFEELARVVVVFLASEVVDDAGDEAPDSVPLSSSFDMVTEFQGTTG